MEYIHFTENKNKARMSKLQAKVLMIVFFDTKDVITIKLVPEGQTVNQKYYLEILKKLRDLVRKKRPELCCRWNEIENAGPAKQNVYKYILRITVSYTESSLV
jgi:hypothetical protein